MPSNPYAPPVEAAATSQGGSLTQPVYFGGSMSVEEGTQVESLMHGRQDSARVMKDSLLPLTKSQIAWFAVFAILAVVFAAESIAYDELDQLPSIVLGFLAIVGGIGAVAYHESARRRTRSDLKAANRGVFTQLAGRVDENGIEYLIEEYPIRYQWEDFVGCRVSADAALLYVEYPSQVNFLAASIFAGREQWECVKTLLKARVPILGKMPRLQARRSNSVVRHVASGIKALNRESWLAALVEFDSALTVRPDDAQALRGRMVATSALGDPEKTLAAISDVVAIGKPDTMTRQIRAAALCDVGRYAEALDDLGWSIEHDDQNPDWWTRRSLAFCKLERFDEAVQDATEAIRLDPNNGIALNNRGYALMKRGSIGDAIDDLEAAVAMEPELERPKQLLDEARQIAVQEHQ